MGLRVGIALQYTVAVVDVSPLDVNYVMNYLSNSLQLSCKGAAGVLAEGVESFDALLLIAHTRLLPPGADGSTILLHGDVSIPPSIGAVHSVPASNYFLRSNKETFFEKHSEILIGAMSFITVLLVLVAIAGCVFPDATKTLLQKCKMAATPHCMRSKKGGGYGGGRGDGTSFEDLKQLGAKDSSSIGAALATHSSLKQANRASGYSGKNLSPEEEAALTRVRIENMKNKLKTRRGQILTGAIAGMVSLQRQ
jgi:hypothetical protein